MKSRFLIAAIAAVFALAALTGCPSNKPKEPGATNQKSSTTAQKPAKGGELPSLTVTPKQKNDPSAVVVKVAFAKMELQNTPTFGLTYRTWIMALYERDYDKMWNMLSADKQAKMGAKLQEAISGLALRKQAAEIMLQRGDPRMVGEIKRCDELAVILQPFDAKRFMGWIIDQGEAKSGNNPAYSHFEDPIEFTGEKVEGNKGVATTSADAPNDKIPFVREGGEWKVDFMPVTEAQIDSAMR